MLTIELLGELGVRRDGQPLALPKSKKTRALLALLVQSSRSHRRERLCEMLWDVPDDPRGALRWSLSKLRAIVDEPGAARLVADRDSIRFDPIDTQVDVVSIGADLAGGAARLETEHLEAIAARFRGGFLDGLDIGACPDFATWRLAERESLRRTRKALLEELARRYVDRPDRAIPHLRTLTVDEPLDEAAHGALIEALARAGRQREAESQIEIARRVLRGTGRHGAIDQALARARASAVVPAPRTPEPPAPPAPAHVRVRVALPVAVVLPFEVLGDDLDQRDFADGLTHDLITELARFRALFTVASPATFQVGGGFDRAVRATWESGAAYVAEGSVRRSGNRVRIAINLSEPEHKTSLWSQRFDRELIDVFAVQDEITRQTVGTLAGRIAARQADLARRKPAAALDAYDCMLLGMDALDRYTIEDHDRAKVMYGRARVLDGDAARPLAGLAATHIYDWFLTDDRTELDRAHALAQEAMQRDPDDAWCAMVAGRVLLHRRRFDLALHVYDQAIALNPHDADIWASRAYLLTCLGRAEAGVTSAQNAMLLNPHHRVWFWENLGNALFALRRYGDALVAFRKVPEPPAYVLAYAAACLVRLGRGDEARATARSVIALDPTQSLARHRRSQPYADPAGIDDFIDALAAAGFPEMA